MLVATASYPEGPLVVGDVLYFTEMGNDRVMRIDGAGVATIFWTRHGCGPTSMARLETGFLVLCHRQDLLVRVSKSGQTLATIDRDGEGMTFDNPNAAIADGRGGAYFSASGIFSANAAPTGAVLHLAPNGRLDRVAEGIHYANGVALSPDGTVLYVSEHLERRILAFGVAADGMLAGRRVFRSLDEFVGLESGGGWWVGPDGLGVDRSGNLLIAEYGAGRLLLMSPDGELKATLAVANRFVTAGAFSADGSLIYVTAPAALYPNDLGAVYALPNPLAAD
jgi:sugar lactone lactonase YvrE